jgi:hypothetical protein
MIAGLPEGGFSTELVEVHVVNIEIDEFDSNLALVRETARDVNFGHVLIASSNQMQQLVFGLREWKSIFGISGSFNNAACERRIDERRSAASRLHLWDFLSAYRFYSKGSTIGQSLDLRIPACCEMLDDSFDSMASHKVA